MADNHSFPTPSKNSPEMVNPMYNFIPLLQKHCDDPGAADADTGHAIQSTQPDIDVNVSVEHG